MTQVALIGAGVMGACMARRLHIKGYALIVYDQKSERLAQLHSEGLNTASSVNEAVRDADVVITMLPDSKTVRSVVEGRSGIMSDLAHGSLFIDMSTGAPDDVKQLGKSLAGIGVAMVDAPVGRPPSSAADGTLVIMAGGGSEAVSRAWPLFCVLGETIHHVGPLGAGMTLKIINNYMSMVGMLLTAEALTLGRKAGIDRAQLIDVISKTAAGRGQLSVNYPNKVLAGDLSADFPMRLGLKDLGLALDLGVDETSPLTLGGVAREFFNIGLANGYGEHDCTAMLVVLEAMAGLTPSVDQASFS